MDDRQMSMFQDIKDIFPEKNDDIICDAIKKYDDLEAALYSLSDRSSTSKSRKTTKRTIAIVKLPDENRFYDVIEDELRDLRSYSIEQNDISPQHCISINHNDFPCKPIIYFETNPIDIHFIRSIEPWSILLSDNYRNTQIQSLCAFHNITLLPVDDNSVKDALHSVLVMNDIKGTGFNTQRKDYIDTWEYMLTAIPGISETTAKAIRSKISSPFHIVHHQITGDILTSSGHKLSRGIIQTLNTLFTEKNPAAPVRGFSHPRL